MSGILNLSFPQLGLFAFPGTVITQAQGSKGLGFCMPGSNHLYYPSNKIHEVNFVASNSGGLPILFHRYFLA